MKEYANKQISRACDLFNAIFKMQNLILKSTVIRTIQRFLKTGSMKDHMRNEQSKSPMMKRMQIFCKVLSKHLIHSPERLL